MSPAKPLDRSDEYHQISKINSKHKCNFKGTSTMRAADKKETVNTKLKMNALIEFHKL